MVHSDVTKAAGLSLRVVLQLQAGNLLVVFSSRRRTAPCHDCSRSIECLCQSIVDFGSTKEEGVVGGTKPSM